MYIHETETVTPQRLGIAIDLRELEGLMGQFLAECKAQGHSDNVQTYKELSLSLFLVWLRAKRKEE